MFLQLLRAAGVEVQDDPRFAEMVKKLEEAPEILDLKSFTLLVSSEILLISETLSGELIIPVPISLSNFHFRSWPEVPMLFLCILVYPDV